MRTDLSPDTDVSLLPRADLPVIWDAFKAKAELVRATAETLTVTCITQKEEMALARTTRLTLREIRIAVEKKRVELGESHLKEIKKVNGAATAIKEFIEPLEARLLTQEGFAERHEANRIAELSKSRNAELNSVRPGTFISNAGQISQADYDAYLARLRAEQAEIEAANRLRIEAERRLAVAQAEALAIAEASRAALELAQRVALEEKNRRDAEVRAELERQRILAQQERDAVAWRVQQERVEADGRLAEQKRLNDEAEKVRFEQEAKHRTELAAQNAIRNIERAEAEQRRQADLRIEREKTAVLEAELARERAAKQAEADAARKLALAPDVEKVLAFARYLREIQIPLVTSVSCQLLMDDASSELIEAAARIEAFCERI